MNEIKACSKVTPRKGTEVPDHGGSEKPPHNESLMEIVNCICVLAMFVCVVVYLMRNYRKNIHSKVIRWWAPRSLWDLLYIDIMQGHRVLIFILLIHVYMY